MDIDALWQAYGDFVDEARSGASATDPPGDERAAARVVALVAMTHEQLVDAGESVLVGDTAWYVVDRDTPASVLDHYAARYGGMPGLADRVAETAVTLCSLAEQLRDRLETPVRAYRRVDGRLVPTEPVAWGRLLELDATKHVAEQLAQLRALRG